MRQFRDHMETRLNAVYASRIYEKKPYHDITNIFQSFQDLIKYTPEEHPDYEMLQAFMKHAQEFLERNYSQQSDVDVSLCFKEYNVISKKIGLPMTNRIISSLFRVL